MIGIQPGSRKVTDGERELLLKSLVLSKLTQVRLAKLADVSAAWLNRVLKGKVDICGQERLGRIAMALADTLDQKGDGEQILARELRALFLNDSFQTMAYEAMKCQIAIGLVNCGLNIDLQSAQRLAVDPLLPDRVAMIIRVIKGVRAICLSSPGSLDNPDSRDLLLSGITNCGLRVSQEAAGKLLSDIESAADKVVTALEGVVEVLKLAREG
jgi:hypothetical protein